MKAVSYNQRNEGHRKALCPGAQGGTRGHQQGPCTVSTPQGPSGSVKKKVGGKETSVKGELTALGGQRLSKDLEISARYIINSSVSKSSACNAGDQLRFLGQEDPLEKGMATHSTILAWRIPWTDEPSRLQSMGLQRVCTLHAIL